MTVDSFELSLESEGSSLAAVATIGVFDGVHRGHRSLLRTVVERARVLGLPSLAISFDPHPVQVFAPDSQPSRISCRSVQSRLFASVGLDHVWYLPFSRAMAELSPRAFVEYVCRRLELAELWIGYDFRFGRDRAGDHPLLVAEGERIGFAVEKFEAVEAGGRIVSSTRIREALRDGRVEEAADLLESPYELEGEVIRGLGLGARELVATANLQLPPDQLLPARGIYAAWSYDPAGDENDESGRPCAWPTVVSLGVRPTVLSDGADLVEAHRIGWEGNLYGSRLRLRLATKLRDEKKFDGLDPLREAIDSDIRRAGEWLRGHPRSAGPDWVPKWN